MAELLSFIDWLHKFYGITFDYYITNFSVMMIEDTYREYYVDYVGIDEDEYQEALLQGFI